MSPSEPKRIEAAWHDGFRLDRLFPMPGRGRGDPQVRATQPGAIKEPVGLAERNGSVASYPRTERFISTVVRATARATRLIL